MTVVAVVAQSFVVSSFGGDDAPSDAGSDPNLPLTLLIPGAEASSDPRFCVGLGRGPEPLESLEQKRLAYITAAMVIIGLIVGPGLVTACCVTERPMFTQHKGCRIDCSGANAEEEQQPDIDTPRRR